jgi:hypothetical protein
MIVEFILCTILLIMMLVVFFVTLTLGSKEGSLSFTDVGWILLAVIAIAVVSFMDLLFFLNI